LAPYALQKDTPTCAAEPRQSQTIMSKEGRAHNDELDAVSKWALAMRNPVNRASTQRTAPKPQQ